MMKITTIIPGLCATYFVCLLVNTHGEPKTTNEPAPLTPTSAETPSTQPLKRENTPSEAQTQAERPRKIIPPLAQRTNMSRPDRLRLLESLGEVPFDANETDWQLAESTSWWGRRLNPSEFWRGRVVWLDDSARMAARRHGRGYPPPPYDDPRLTYPDDEGKFPYGGVEGPNLHFVTSSKEMAFWDLFGKTMPHPPEQLAREQQNVADAILGIEHRNAQLGNSGDDAETVQARQRTYINRATQLACPIEALDRQALFWAYVLQKRAQYEQQTSARGVKSITNLAFLGRLYVGDDLITMPLTAEQITAASTWKIAYLQRLRREKTDHSYIDAYMKAWNLTSAQVFGEQNQ